eukprot:10179519-Heterocapsa_arctica.AAC.1
MAAAFWKDAPKLAMQARSLLERLPTAGNQAGQSPRFFAGVGLFRTFFVFFVRRRLLGGSAESLPAESTR